MSLFRRLKRTSRPAVSRAHRRPTLEVLEDRCVLWAYDPTFTSAGLPSGHVFVPNSGEASSILLQDDGKVILGGWVGSGTQMHFGMTRVRGDGQLDPTFGNGGMVQLPFYDNESFQAILAMAIQPWDGAIVVTGLTSPAAGQGFVFALMRFDSNGQLDQSFGGVNGDEPGKVSFRFENELGQTMTNGRSMALAIQDDRKIVVGGTADFLPQGGTGERFAIARLNTDGTLDPTFGEDGMNLFEARDQGEIHSMELMPADEDGLQKIVVAGIDRLSVAAGYDFAVARLLSDGRPDPTFAPDSPYSGIRLIDFGFGHADLAWDLVVQPHDGKIVVTGVNGYLSEFGDAHGDFAVVRLTQDGMLDPDFGVDGKAVADIAYYDIGYGVALQQHGKNANKIIVAGYTLVQGTGFVLTGARFNTDGSVDETFVSNFTNTAEHGDQARGVVIQPDDKIVAGGFHTELQIGGFAAVRLCSNPRRCAVPIQLQPISPLPAPDISPIPSRGHQLTTPSTREKESRHETPTTHRPSSPVPSRSKLIARVQQPVQPFVADLYFSVLGHLSN